MHRLRRGRDPRPQGHTAVQRRRRRRVGRLALADARVASPRSRTSPGCSALTRRSVPIARMCLGKFRVSVTPYYASLIDPDDPYDPVRPQAVPTPAELVVHSEELNDSIAEDFDSPTPRLDAPLPGPRALRRHRHVPHVLPPLHAPAPRGRQRADGLEDADIDNAITYIARSPEVRDVLISGGDPLSLATRSSRTSSAACAPSRTWRSSASARACPWCCPQRITPELVAMLQEVPPALVQHALQPPARDHAGGRPPATGWPTPGIPGQPVGAAARRERLRPRDDAAGAQAPAVRVRPYYFYQCDLAEGTAHFRTSVRRGLEIHEGLRGHTTGFAVADLRDRRHRRRREDAGVPQLRDHARARPGGGAQLRGRDQPLRRARRLRQGRVPLPRLRGRPAAARRGRPVRRGHGPVLSDVWAARMQKVVDRKNRMADVFGEVEV